MGTKIGLIDTCHNYTNGVKGWSGRMAGESAYRRRTSACDQPPTGVAVQANCVGGVADDSGAKRALTPHLCALHNGSRDYCSPIPIQDLSQ